MRKVLDIFFSPHGRIPRGLWWASWFIYAIPMGFLLTLIQKSNPQLAIVFQLLIGIPFIFVNGKRFHDRNKSAWWQLIAAIPFIGVLWMFIECGCLAGTPGPNRFGFPNIFGNELKMMRTSQSSRHGTTPGFDRNV
jgi:uncharacterized membrane protein YhaH (DUF805 family)